MTHYKNRNLLSLYNTAKKYVNTSGYANEGNWQLSLRCNDFTETDLLRESAWVILNTGFKETIVRRCFDYISLCFCDWESAESILSTKSYCKDTALCKINNIKKIEAIIGVAACINKKGFQRLKNDIVNDPINELQSLPYIGSVTSYHLAKNLGFPIAKPDRHLIRYAENFGYDCVQKLCSHISIETGDPVPYVDIVLWRYATLMASA